MNPAKCIFKASVALFLTSYGTVEMNRTPLLM